MLENFADATRRIARQLYFDEFGLNLSAVSYTVAWTVALVLAIRAASASGHVDVVQWSLGIAVICVGYGAAGGRRARTNGRIASLEARVQALENSVAQHAA
jgi:hypothetical protein